MFRWTRDLPEIDNIEIVRERRVSKSIDRPRESRASRRERIGTNRKQRGKQSTRTASIERGNGRMEKKNRSRNVLFCSGRLRSARHVHKRMERCSFVREARRVNAKRTRRAKSNNAGLSKLEANKIYGKKPRARRGMLVEKQRFFEIPRHVEGSPSSTSVKRKRSRSTRFVDTSNVNASRMERECFLTRAREAGRKEIERVAPSCE